MPFTPHQRIDIGHSSDIAAARRAGQLLGSSLGFDDTRQGRLAIVVTEAATNILKHAGSGRLLLAARPDEKAVDVLALDKGPGISDLAQSLRDGVSTAGTPGNGLGAMRRQSDAFDVFTQPGKGSAFYLSISGAEDGDSAIQDVRMQVGAVCCALPGEDLSGDGWAVARHGDAWLFELVDGLGHGPEAARAAQAAIDALSGRAHLEPETLIDAAHGLLRPTRGAALAVAKVLPDGESLGFAGVGNIAVCVATDGHCKQLMSHNGIVGHNVRKIQRMDIRMVQDSVLVMHSDGVSKHWNLSDYPGLMRCHPSLIAGVLYRDNCRDSDDATVLVARLRKGTTGVRTP